VYAADDLTLLFVNAFSEAMNTYDVFNHKMHVRFDNFWPDCSIQLITEVGCPMTVLKNNAVDVVRLICNFKVREDVYFSPNLTHNGVHGVTDSYGGFSVVARGTLNQQSKVVGVFKQTKGHDLKLPGLFSCSRRLSLSAVFS
jgi:hypothetical protein